MRPVRRFGNMHHLVVGVVNVGARALWVWEVGAEIPSCAGGDETSYSWDNSTSDCLYLVASFRIREL